MPCELESCSKIMSYKHIYHAYEILYIGVTFVIQSTVLIFYFQKFYYAYFLYFRFPSFPFLFITILVIELRTSHILNRL